MVPICGNKPETIYTVNDRFDLLEIPYILKWAFHDRYTSYKASIQINTAHALHADMPAKCYVVARCLAPILAGMCLSRLHVW